MTLLKALADMAVHGRGKITGCAAHQDVDFAEFLSRFLHGGFDGGIIADVQGAGCHDAAGMSGWPPRLNPIFPVCGRARVTFAPCSAKSLRHALPDAGSSAGHERIFPVEQTIAEGHGPSKANVIHIFAGNAPSRVAVL